MRVGFSLLRGGGGPTIFMSRLRKSLAAIPEIRTTSFLDPRADVLLFANAVRNVWRRPYVLRMDGIYFDLALGEVEIDRRNAFYLKAMQGASGLVIQSRYNHDFIDQHLGIPDIPVTVINNGVDLSRFSPNGASRREALGIPRDATVFIASAKWRSHKRLPATLDCFARFRKRNKVDARLLVLGEVLEKPKHVPEGVQFVGHTPHDELPEFYRTADVCLFLSWLDNCPNTVVEALACGLPVLCSNQGGTRELVELTQGGVVAEADNPYAFERVKLYESPNRYTGRHQFPGDARLAKQPGHDPA